MSLNDDTENAVILNVQFGEDVVAITYMESRDVGEGAMVQRTIMVDPDQVEEEVGAVHEAAQVLVDEALLVLRKPANKLNRTSAMLRAAEAGE